MKQESLFDWTPHEMKRGKQFDIGDKVTGPTVMSNPMQKGLTKGPYITGSVTDVGWKYLRTDNGDIWRDVTQYQGQSQILQGELFLADNQDNSGNVPENEQQ